MHYRVVLFLVLVFFAWSTGALSGENAPAAGASRVLTVDGFKDFKFGMTLKDISSRKLCRKMGKESVNLTPPEDASYWCSGISFNGGTARSGEVTFIKGKLARVAITIGYSLTEFAATQTALLEKYGEWNGDGHERTQAFIDGTLPRIERNFVGGAIRLSGTRPVASTFVIVRVDYFDLPTYRASGPKISAKDL